jgi:hypothetical protein
MKSPTPPPLATWLLQRFGAKEALVGDLVEQYQRGRSGVWYWRQVVIAIVAGIVAEVRYHPWFTVRAMLLGWTLRWIGKTPYAVGMLDTPGRIVAHKIGAWMLDNGHETLWYWWIRSQIAFLPRWGMWWIVCAGIGWTVAYTHRARQSAILVLLFASSVLIAVSPWIIRNLERDEWSFMFTVVVRVRGLRLYDDGWTVGRSLS